MDMPTSFGYWVRRRRKALDLTQAELARRVGCAEVTIQKIEADERRPSGQIAELLAEHLRLPPNERATFMQRARGELATEQLPASTQMVDTIPIRPRWRRPMHLRCGHPPHRSAGVTCRPSPHRSSAGCASWLTWRGCSTNHTSG